METNLFIFIAFMILKFFFKSHLFFQFTNLAVRGVQRSAGTLKQRLFPFNKISQFAFVMHLHKMCVLIILFSVCLVKFQQKVGKMKNSQLKNRALFVAVKMLSVSLQE
ncbi:hypothetical protein ILYODFUR_029924 [Ilyodon furcidens]|uniref:Uncharacterized protein n=1 Tax=Ilyodon furcidens TaxID=33524 RepID=A0ABV0V782_9TELE